MKRRLSAFWFNALLQLLILVAFFAVLVSQVGDALNPIDIAMPGVQGIRVATLIGKAGTTQVYLPNILQPEEFRATGSMVRYRLQTNLREVPDRPLAVLIPKMALSGNLAVNGVAIGQCGSDWGEAAHLADMRCLHQPQFFVVPAPLWRTGTNVLDITVYATDRQVNGLSAVFVGAEQPLQQYFAHQRWLRSDVPIALAWMSLVLGLLSLGLGVMLWRDSVYLWFGLTSLVNAVATTNSFVIHPVVPIEVFNWLAFSARLISVPMLFVTVLAFFGHSNRRVGQLCLAFAALAPLAIWFSDNDRTLALGLYVPWLIMGLAIVVGALVWGARSQHFSGRLVAALMVALALSGLIDWLKASGFTNFETVFLVPYAFGIALLLMGGALVMMVAATLGASVRRTTALERELSERIAYAVTRNIPIGTFSVMLPSGAHRAYFLFVSERFAELTRTHNPGGQDIGVLRALVHPEDRDRWDDQFAAAIARRESMALSFRIIVPDTVRWITVEARPRFLVDGSVIWDGVLADETEKVLANAAAERDRAALQESRIAQSRLREREELLRDMHDGFGSQLACLGMLARRGDLSSEQMSAQLDEIADDLYLMVDTMGHTGLRLDHALAAMRYRVMRRLAASAVRLTWRIELDALPEFEAQRVLQILRILQEALHNALKHADATGIEIGATFDPVTRRLTAWVRDNGCGLPDELRAGRGLNNIRQRAREIGADLSLANTGQGTEVVMELVLADALDSS